jgi:NAD(P)-dependent dehydrogenase (short-subunit alcohol dehydrogenase family)
VVLAVRNVHNGQTVARGIGGDTTVRHLDLADLSTVRRFVDELDHDVDVLVNNAGVMGVPAGTTVDGFETQFGVNYLGPFALTGRLLPRLRDRVVTVSSQAHRQGRLDLADPHARRRRYDPSAAYAQSKLASLMFAFELGRRLAASGSRIRSLAAHPGLAQSNLLTGAQPTLRLRLTAAAQRRLGQPTDAGALSILYAATVDLPNCTYVGPSGFYQLRGTPRIVTASRAAQNADVARRLWQLSEQDTGLSFSSPRN